MYMLVATERVSDSERSSLGHQQSYNQRPQGTGICIVFIHIIMDLL